MITFNLIYNIYLRNSLVVQRLGLGAFTVKGPGSVPGQGTEIPQAPQRGQKNKIKYLLQTEISNKWRKWIKVPIFLFFQKPSPLNLHENIQCC